MGMAPFFFGAGMNIFGYDINLWAIVVIFILAIIAYGLIRANKDPNTDFEWVHLVTDVDQATGKVKASATKILQLIGGITGTFIVVKLTLQNNLPFEIFGAYLAYVASIDGFSKFMLARYGAGQQQYPPPYTPPYYTPVHRRNRFDPYNPDYVPPPKPVDNTDP